MELYAVVAILLGHSLQGLLAGPPVEVYPESIILLENRPLEVKCRVRQPIAYCRFDVPGIADGLSLRPGIPPHEGIQYSGAGFEKGECGMLIQSVSSKNSGTIHCSMGFSNEPIESKGNVTLIVAKPPDPPILQLYPGSFFRNAFREGEVIQANCRIVNARPAANISWYLGSEPIYDRLGPTRVEDEENGLKSVSQNMSRKVSYLDHGKDLKCVAGHMALSQRNINHSIHKLDIRFPPKPKSQELEKFGFTIGQPEKIVVSFQANPIPDIIWKVDQDNLKQGTRDRTGRFEAGVLQHKGAGMWDATLLINTVRPEEVEKRYTLIAQNELGQESYKVAISTSPEPPADITAGTIVGIVIAVLVILLVIFILIFARATGRWCFAAGTNGKKSSSEVAIEDGTDEKRPPSIQGKDGVYSSTEYINGSDKKRSSSASTRIVSSVFASGSSCFSGTGVSGILTNRDAPNIRHAAGRWFPARKSQRNPEKVNSLVYKDYTLVEHEDGTKAYVSPQDKSRLLLQGKLNAPKPAPPPVSAIRDIVSDSESEYEIPIAKHRQHPHVDLTRNSSYPFSPGETSPGDNGRINLPPYIVPLETSLTLPGKKKKDAEGDARSRFSLREPFWARTKKTSDAQESPEDAEVREISDRGRLPSVESSEGEEKTGAEVPDGQDEPQGGDTRFRPFSLSTEALKSRERRRRAKKLDTNPLRKMFGMRGAKEPDDRRKGRCSSEEDVGSHLGRYSDAALSEVQSDTESADHGSADKSSVSKLTNEKQPKKLMSGLLGSFRKGKSKDRTTDNDLTKIPSSFEITLKDPVEDVDQAESVRAEGIVYAELDMARSPGSVMRREDEKTEYAEIIYPGSKTTAERTEDLRKSRENLSTEREQLTEVDEAFSTTPEGKKEAAV